MIALSKGMPRAYRLAIVQASPCGAAAAILLEETGAG
jgi:hypothetical protein